MGGTSNMQTQMVGGQDVNVQIGNLQTHDQHI